MPAKQPSRKSSKNNILSVSYIAKRGAHVYPTQYCQKLTKNGKEYFDQRFEHTATKQWSNYTTTNFDS